MTEAEIWKEVAHRIAGYFRPTSMPQHVIDAIERSVRREDGAAPALATATKRAV